MLALVNQQFNPLIRYLLPAYPIVIAFGGYGIYRLWNWGRKKRNYPRRSFCPLPDRPMLGCSSSSGNTFLGSAFVNGVYDDTHPRISASEWINENIEPNSTVTHQIWDDRLPLPISGETPPNLKYVDLDLFRSDQLNDPRSGEPNLLPLLITSNQPTTSSKLAIGSTVPSHECLQSTLEPAPTTNSFPANLGLKLLQTSAIPLHFSA